MLCHWLSNFKILQFAQIHILAVRNIQAREKFDKKLDVVKVTSLDKKEPISSITPEAPTQIFNPHEFEIKDMNNFDEFPFFFENLLDKAEMDLKENQQAKQESQGASTSKW